MSKQAPRHYPLPMRILFRVLVDPSGCWLWQGAKDPAGYACMTFEKKPMRVHRASYESFVGPIPEGLQLDHLCRVRHCVNPRHLEPVTCMENIQRSPIHHGAKTHCPYGHPYDGANLRVQAGRRICGTCRAINNSVRPYDPVKARQLRLAARSTASAA